MLTPNILATNILVTCESPIPATSPIPNDITPIISVSRTSISDIFLFPIPRRMYNANSFFLFFIRKLLAYITRNPSINATNTLTPESVVLISFTISLVSSDILSIVVCVSIALKR